MSKASDTPERPFKTFQRGKGNGIFLGGWYAIASTILRYGLSIDAFLSIDFLTRFVVAAVVGIILAGAWEVLSEVILQKYDSSRTAREGSFTRSRFLVEGVVRFGLPIGIFLAIATTFARPGISLDPRLWLEFLIALAIYLPASIPIGCVFGLFTLGMLKMFGPPVDDGSD